MSTLVEDGKEYFTELLSRFDEKTYSFHQPSDKSEIKPDDKSEGKTAVEHGGNADGNSSPLARKFTKRNPNFCDLLRLVSEHLKNEILLEFATKIIGSISFTNSKRSPNSGHSPNSGRSSAFIHRHLLPEWKELIGKFLGQVEVVKWNLNSFTKDVDLKIRICSSPPRHLLIYYNVYKSQHDSDVYYDSDDENEKLKFKLVLESLGEQDGGEQKVDAKGNLVEELSFENLLAIKNQNLGLANLPLNIWLSCLFEMITALLAGKQTKTADHRPTYFGSLLQLKYFPKLDGHYHTQSALNKLLPAAENQCWVPEKNIYAPCYARFIDNSNVEKKQLNLDQVTTSSSSSSKRRGKEHSSVDTEVGRWVKIPEKSSELLVYRSGVIKSERERERIIIEVCAFVRNSMLREFVDCVLGPISLKLRQDAYTFLKMLNFATDLTEMQQDETVLKNESWWIAVNGVDVVDANDRITGEIDNLTGNTTVSIVRRRTLIYSEGKKKRVKKTIYYDETRNSQSTKKSRNSQTSTQTSLSHSALSRTSKSFPTAFVCPLLTDANYPTATIREFLSWIFVVDEQIFEDSDFREKLFGTNAVESFDLSDLGSSNPVKDLSIMKCIDTNRDLKKFLFAGLNPPTATKKSNSKIVSKTAAAAKGNQLNGDLCNLVLGYAIIFTDPIKQELYSSNPDDDSSGSETEDSYDDEYSDSSDDDGNA